MRVGLGISKNRMPTRAAHRSTKQEHALEPCRLAVLRDCIDGEGRVFSRRRSPDAAVAGASWHRGCRLRPRSGVARATDEDYRRDMRLRSLALLAACANLAAPAVEAAAVEQPPVEASTNPMPVGPCRGCLRAALRGRPPHGTSGRVPLDVVVDKLQVTTGVKFRGEWLRDWREVTKRFDGVPLPEALDRILGRQNLAVRYDADGIPSSSSCTGRRCRGSRPRLGKRTAANFLALLGKAPPVALSPALRQTLRTPTARPAQLFMAAVHQADAAVRVEARASIPRRGRRQRRAERHARPRRSKQHHAPRRWFIARRPCWTKLSLDLGLRAVIPSCGACSYARSGLYSRSALPSRRGPNS